MSHRCLANLVKLLSLHALQQHQESPVLVQMIIQRPLVSGSAWLTIHVCTIVSVHCY